MKLLELFFKVRIVAKTENRLWLYIIIVTKVQSKNALVGAIVSIKDS